jgi:hypothetical protein
MEQENHLCVEKSASKRRMEQKNLFPVGNVHHRLSTLQIDFPSTTSRTQIIFD